MADQLGAPSIYSSSIKVDGNLQNTYDQAGDATYNVDMSSAPETNYSASKSVTVTADGDSTNAVAWNWSDGQGFNPYWSDLTVSVTANGGGDVNIELLLDGSELLSDSYSQTPSVSVSGQAVDVVQLDGDGLASGSWSVDIEYSGTLDVPALISAYHSVNGVSQS